MARKGKATPPSPPDTSLPNLIDDSRVNRRTFLSTGTKAAAGVAAAAAIAGVGGFYVGGGSAPAQTKTVTSTSTQTVSQSQSTSVQTVSQSQTSSASALPIPSNYSIYTQRALDTIWLYHPITKPLAQVKSWSSPPSQYANKGQILVGMTDALTGIFAAAGGIAWSRVVKYWVDDLNSRGGLLGLPVKLVVYDDQSQAQNAIANMQKLIQVDHADLLFTGFPTPTVDPAVRAIDDLGAISMTFGSANIQGYTDKPVKNSFITTVQEPAWSWPTWQWIASLPHDIRPKSVAIVYGNYSPFSVGNAAAAKDFAGSLGINVVYYQGYSADTQDFGPLVTQMKASGADIHVHCDAGPPQPEDLQLRAMQDQDWNPRISYNAANLYLTAFVDQSTGYVKKEADYCVTGFFNWPTWPFKDAQKWFNAYSNFLGIKNPYSDIAQAIVACQIYEAAVQSSGSVDPTVLKSTLQNNSFETVSGTMEFNRYNIVCGWHLALAQVMGDGKFQIIWPNDLATGLPHYPRPTWAQLQQGSIPLP